MRNIPGFTAPAIVLEQDRVLLVRAEREGQPMLLRVLAGDPATAEDLAWLRYGYEVAHQLDLPGVLRPSGFERFSSQAAVLMPDLGLLPLRLALDRAQPSLTDALRIACQVAETLGELHRRRVAHLRISPENVFVDERFLATKLSGFEDSSPISDTALVATTHNPKSGLRYVSPEQTGRMNQTLDHRSDFYSLGVTLYEMLTGRVPFDDADPLALVYNHIAVDPIAPHLVSPDVPEVVSRIVMKLLAKDATERYQSAFGVVADLSECQHQLTATGVIESFEIGERDAPAMLSLPRHLYGRDTEVQLLLQGFERVAGGKSELCLVSGASGIGKTALVHALNDPIVKRRGQFGAGKFKQLHAVPYSALLHALGQVLGDILSSSEDEVSAWRRRIHDACGSLEAVVVEVLPELELITGTRQPVPALPATEAQARFNLVFQKFVGALARDDAPLVLFLDDLQWSDRASLNMLERLLGDEELAYFYVIGGYRSDEVDAAHPLRAFLERGRIKGVPVTDIRLEPLGPALAATMLGDILGRVDPAEVAQLNEFVYRVTGGSPLFIGQYLSWLASRELISFDPTRGRWVWDISAIQNSGAPANVGGLMASRLARLAPETQRLLSLAACIGYEFDLHTLAVLCERSTTEAADALWPALHEGFVLSLDDGFKYAHTGDVTAQPARLKFWHDRVREAAYALGESTLALPAIHLKIGRHLLRSTAAADLDAHVFDIVEQLGLGASFITEAEERARLIGLSLHAAQRAKVGGAVSAAFDYASRGIELLGQGGWEQDHALTFALQLERAECAYLLGNHELAANELRVLLEHATTPTEIAAAQELKSTLCIVQMKFDTAVGALLDALRAHGMDLPNPDAAGAAYPSEAAAMSAALAGRSIEQLAQLPVAQDPGDRARLRLLARASLAAFAAGPLVFALLVSRLGRASIEYGNAAGSAWGYVGLGMVAAATGDYTAAHQFGSLALEISPQLDDPQLRAVVRVTANVFNMPWHRSPRSCAAAEEQAADDALAAGDPAFSALARWNRMTLEFVGGVDLAKISSTYDDDVVFFRRFNQSSSAALCGTLHALVSRLRSPAGPTETPDQDFRQNLELLQGYAPGLGACACFGSGPAVILREWDSARELLNLTESRMPVLLAHPARVEFSLYRGLFLAHSCEGASEEQRGEYLARIDEDLAQLAVWDELCADNFRHKHRLLAAERARIVGNESLAMQLYDEAIDAAANHGFVQLEALASELAGRFHLARERQRVANTYLDAARAAYLRWGAHCKVAALDDEFATATSRSMPPASRGDHDTESALDLLSVVKASQAISSEVVLSVLLERLMGTLVENAGAQRGLFVVSGEPEQFAWVDAVSGAVGPLSDSPGPFGFAKSLVRRVQRTRETLVFDDAKHDRALTSDPYVSEASPRSVLCMPILARSKLVGVLYLENNATRAAFTPQRCKVLELLSAQAAISLENARLYDTLESRVRSRTQELADRNQELSSVIARLNATQQQLVANEKLASLGTLTAGVAHELKNPLNFISNFATLSAGLVSELSEELHARKAQLGQDLLGDADDILNPLRDNVSKIKDHARRADGIINAMLLHARGASGATSPVELNDLVATCVNLAVAGRSNEPNESVDVQLECDPNVGTVEVRQDDLRRVIVNLLNNANDALVAKRRTAPADYRPAIRVSTRRNGDRVEVRVRDNGSGIPEDVLPKIYDPFFTTKGVGEGTGLGLSICHGIVRAHQGELEASSKLGEYAEFTIRLPDSHGREASQMRRPNP